MSELKKCPFCGGYAHLDKAYSYFRDIVIYCEECDAVFTLDDCNATAEDIVNAWNKRQKMSEWIPVTERLPEEGQIVCVSDGRNAWDYGQFRGTLQDDVTIWHWKKRTINWKKQTTKTVKWWMPKSDALPEPPKEKPE